MHITYYILLNTYEVKKKLVSVLLHNIRSMHNVGSVFRTSDGAGVSKIYLTGYTPCPPRKEIYKTALGAEEVIPWEYHPDPLPLLKRLKKEGIEVVALEKNQNSKNIQDFHSNHSVCMILGNEIEGVNEELLQLSDVVLHIPMHGKKESLNVSVAFGVGIYSLTQKKSR